MGTCETPFPAEPGALGVVLVLLGAGRGGLILLDLPVERIAISGAGRNVSTEAVESLVAPRIRQAFLL